jgi:MoaA/NifB/PqqE/SkfB family radical SAM enzyme
VNFGIILAARCNASCEHCSKNYGPRRTELLELSEILRFMDEAAATNTDAELGFDLTGGEPFLDFDRLVAVTRNGTRLGAAVSCVTNAFWARSDDLARSRLEVLRAAGLTHLSVSVSRFHQRFVPLHRAERALRIAGELRMSTELKGAVTKADLRKGAALSKWKRTLDADKINIFPILPYLREGAVIPEAEYYRLPDLPRLPCPGEEICIYTDGVVRSCCGPGVGGSFLAIGDVQTPMQEIRQAFLHGAKQEILRQHGPIHFAERAAELGMAHKLRKAYAGPCDLCVHISRDPELRRVAEDVASHWVSSREPPADKQPDSN